MPIDKMKSSISNLFSSDKTEYEIVKEILQEVKEKNIERPFEALISMPQDKRNNIRLTLDFKWSQETRNSSEKNRSIFEAWEILNCNIKGIVSRLHSIKEQINPMNFNGWRKTIARILDLTGVHFNASDSEEELEILILSLFEQNKKLTKKSDSSLPTTGAAKLGKGIGIAASILKDVGTIWDDVLGSEDEPAINAVYAICKIIHNDNP